MRVLKPIIFMALQRNVCKYSLMLTGHTET